LNKQEVDKTLRTIKASYQNRFDLNKDVVKVWEYCLKDEDGKSVMANLMRHIKSNPFPPSIADVTSKNDWEHTIINSIPEDLY